MCKRCEEREIDRRSLLALAGFGMAAASLGLGMRPAIAADAKKTALTPDQALAALKEGTARFVSNPQAPSIGSDILCLKLAIDLFLVDAQLRQPLPGNLQENNFLLLAEQVHLALAGDVETLGPRRLIVARERL